MHKIAAIDVGSNTVHLLVGIARRNGRVEHVVSENELLELGREVEEHGRIRRRKARKVRKVLRRYVKLARRAGAKEVLVAATGAMRRATNGKSVARKLAREAGVPVRIISGEAEARLAFTGAAAALEPDAPQLLIDSGGASTEVSLTSGRSRRASASMGIGASLLIARLANDPPGPLEWARLSLVLGEELHKLPTAPRPSRALAVGGAAHRLEELHAQGRGAAITLQGLERIAWQLLRHPSRRIARRTGIKRKKITLLAAGALILHAIISHYGLEELHVGHAGLRDGMILAWRRAKGNWWRRGR